MQKITATLLITLIIITAISQIAAASGISVDSGLTPPEDRWIVRTQFRSMRRENGETAMNRKMETFKVPLVIAYGYRPDLTLMVRQITTFKNMQMSGTTSRESGLEDLFLLAKYKLYRKNTPDYSFGLAPTLALEVPTGTNGFSSHTWDIQPGMFASWRSGPWSTDFNFAYKWNGFADRGIDNLNPGNKLAADLALGHQFSINNSSDNSLTPLVEFSYSRTLPDRRDNSNIDNTGQSLFFISPGIKLTMSSFILEALIQIPVWQDQEGNQLDQETRLIVGTRIMF